MVQVYTNVRLDLSIVGVMEPNTIQPYVAPQTITKVKHNDILNDNIERVDRNIIQSIVAQFPNKEIVFSVNNLSSRIVCIFKQMQCLDFHTLHKIYLLSDKIKVINAMIHANALEIQIHKVDAERAPVTIKKRPNTLEIETCATKFVEKVNMHKSDNRLCLELVKLLYKWTWGTVACKVDVNLFGDTYHYTVSSLRNVSFKQLNVLNKLSDLVTDIQVNFKQNWLAFKVTRTNEYITLSEISKKRRKL